MQIKRQHTRIKCSFYCILVGRNGDAYHALLGDISLGGAFVMTKSDTRLQVGDICQLMLSDDTATFPIKRTGKVVRLDCRCIGMSLIN